MFHKLAYLHHNCHLCCTSSHICIITVISQSGNNPPALANKILIKFNTTMYNKPKGCNSGSIVFINNYKYAPHVSDALCVHHGHGIVQCTTDLEHLYRIYSIPIHDKHQWLLLHFIVLLMREAKGVRNM